MRIGSAWRLLLVGALLILPGGATASEPSSDGEPAATTSSPQPQESLIGVAAGELLFSIQVGNRLYPGWSEDFQIGLESRFYLGDTEYTAAVHRFLPDFRIGENGPFSISEELGNPALEVIVYNDSTAVDSVWAFKNFAPHFSPRSFFTFKILEISRAEANRDEVETE